MEAPHDITLTLRSDARLLKAVRGMVRGFVLDAGFSEDKTAEIVLAVDEACANAIRHAYHGSPRRPVMMTLDQADGWVKIEVCDEGIPAPIEKLQKCMDDVGTGDDLKPGGLGVPLMRHVFDEVCFEPGVERGNRIAMRIRHPKKNEG
ncbi:MAG: hypothetical protein GC168_09045 [Candidatus Hydrogenedens sp.]|nr:hypothetical protein [Candidatus Hydrogenedens sp.]